MSRSDRCFLVDCHSTDDIQPFFFQREDGAFFIVDFDAHGCRKHREMYQQGGWEAIKAEIHRLDPDFVPKALRSVPDHESAKEMNEGL